MCLIIYLTGFLFYKEYKWFNYLLLGFAILIGFLPHANIFIGHLKIGGVGGDGGWLAAPTRGYLHAFLFYAFNQSDIIYIIVFGIFIGSFVKFRKTLELNKFHLISISWFVVVILYRILLFNFCKSRIAIFYFIICISFSIDIYVFFYSYRCFQ